MLGEIAISSAPVLRSRYWQANVREKLTSSTMPKAGFRFRLNQEPSPKSVRILGRKPDCLMGQAAERQPERPTAPLMTIAGRSADDGRYRAGERRRSEGKSERRNEDQHSSRLSRQAVAIFSVVFLRHMHCSMRLDITRGKVTPAANLVWKGQQYPSKRPPGPRDFGPWLSKCCAIAAGLTMLGSNRALSNGTRTLTSRMLI